MSNTADKVIAFAMAQRGKPYIWGATGPNAFDCSGLVIAAFRAAGAPLPGRPTTYVLMIMGTSVNKSDLMPGDLVFPDAGHVQIYIGGGNIVEAANSHTGIVSRPMWGFWRARRITAPASGAVIQNTAGGPIQTPADKPQGSSGASDPFSAIGDSISGIQSALDSIGKVASFLSDTHNYMRMGMVLAGIILIFIGLYQVSNSAKKVASTIGKAAANAS